MATSRIAEKMASEGDITGKEEGLNMDEGNVTALGPTDKEGFLECT